MAAIVITEFMDEAAVDGLRERHDVRYDPGLADRPGELPALLGPARALIVRNRTQVTADLLAAAPALRVVGRLGVGLDNIDLTAAKARGVEVIPATGANDLAVAEYVVTTAMMLLRGAYAASEAMLAGEWPRGRLMGRELAGRTVGLVGLGAIAREVATRMRALGATCVAFDPHLPDAHPAWALAGRRELPGLLGEADVVSLHVPLTAETRRLIDAAALAQMREGAVLINAARGGIVDEAALAAALRKGWLGGAALDVFETEPLTREAAAAFAGVPNLILTPHIAGVTQESNVRVSSLIARRVAEALAGTG
jgi:(S)-sulfolactate dehydrogenase